MGNFTEIAKKLRLTFYSFVTLKWAEKDKQKQTFRRADSDTWFDGKMMAIISFYI